MWSSRWPARRHRHHRHRRHCHRRHRHLRQTTTSTGSRDRRPHSRRSQPTRRGSVARPSTAPALLAAAWSSSSSHVKKSSCSDCASSLQSCRVPTGHTPTPTKSGEAGDPARLRCSTLRSSASIASSMALWSIPRCALLSGVASSCSSNPKISSRSQSMAASSGEHCYSIVSIAKSSNYAFDLKIVFLVLPDEC